MPVWTAIFLGGGLGSLARFMVSSLILKVGEQFLPWATFCANIISCAILAIFLLHFDEKYIQFPWVKAFIMIGFCGGFSTFSTFSYENFWLVKNQHIWWMLLNVVVSVATCFFIFYQFLKTEL